MIIKKLLIATWVSLLVLSSTNAAYKEVACSTDEVFNQNSCNQCFLWDTKSVWSNITLMSDKWINNWTTSKLMYKETQEDPSMLALNGSSWSMIPETDSFWQYTDEMNAKYSEELSWYVLKAWEEVTWLKSSLGYAYKLDSTNALNNENIWLLIYPIFSHDISWVDNISVDAVEYRECVIFKASNEEITPPEIITPEKPKPKLPQTWPEYILLLIIAMLAWYGILKVIRRKS